MKSQQQFTLYTWPGFENAVTLSGFVANPISPGHFFRGRNYEIATKAFVLAGGDKRHRCYNLIVCVGDVLRGGKMKKVTMSEKQANNLIAVALAAKAVVDLKPKTKGELKQYEKLAKTLKQALEQLASKKS